MLKNKSANRKYVVVSPKYGVSNGVRTLYYLSKELRNRGYDAQMLSYGYENSDYEFVNEITTDIRNKAIVIYPEVIEGNPLKAKNIVRYVLFYPGENGGKKQYHNSELIFSYSKDFYDTDNILVVPYMDTNIFFDDSSPKNQDCYFVHKGGKWKNVPELEYATEINMEYPKTREELGQLLRRTRTLYSYDSCSAILDEALLCGCNVRIITEEGYIDYSKTDAYSELIKNFDVQIERFINLTQSWDWSEDIEKTDVKLLYKLEVCLKFYMYTLMGNKQKKGRYKWLKMLYT